VISGFFFRPKFHVASHISSKYSCSLRMIRLSQNLNDTDDMLSELRNKIEKLDADILACKSSITDVAEERFTSLKITRASACRAIEKAN
jgi:hypothetical protein